MARPEPGALETIPGVGKSLAGDLRSIGIDSVASLNGKNPDKLYARLCAREGKKIDRCVLYVFRCAVYFAETRNPDPELLKWWNWKDKTEPAPGKKAAKIPSWAKPGKKQSFGFDPAVKKVLDKLLAGHPMVRPGKMFALPAYYAGEKLAVCVFGKSLALKLPEKTVEHVLRRKHVSLFEPMGRKMKEWVLLTRSNRADYARDIDLLLESVDYVKSGAKK